MTVAAAAGEITFSYTYDEIFNVVSLVTNEIAVTILDKESMPMTDEYGISEDEKYTVVQKMYDAANEVFNKFLKITNGVTDSISLAETAISCKIKDKTAYNTNVRNAIDRLIKNSITNYIIGDWFADKKVDHAEIYLLKYKRDLREIVKKSVQLRKPTVA